MLNVVNNAAESVRVVSKSRAIQIRACARGAWVRLSVRDSGPGISGLALRRVFEPRYTTKPDGMCMGLSISRSIVEAHGGRLHAYRSPAGGAVFAVMLPRWKP